MSDVVVVVESHEHGGSLYTAEEAIERGIYENQSIPARVMLYHPFHHAEDLNMQQQAVRLAEQLVANCPAPWLKPLTESLKYVREHREAP